MKKITLLLILNFQLLIFNSSAQSPNWLWAKSAGGASSDASYSCATDANGNVFASGTFSDSITFGTTTLTNAGGGDIFIVKYDPSGNVLWAKSAGGTATDEGSSCNTDAGGNVFVTGYFGSSSITFGTTTLTNAGGADMYIVKYDPGGNVLWAKSAGGTLADYSNSCATDVGGNVFATGSFKSDSITFGSTTLFSVGTAGGDEVFIVKYDPSGNILWAKSTAGIGESDEGWGCATDAGGNVFVSGIFESPSITFGTTTLTNSGLEDFFIVKYDPSGNVLWAKSTGGTDYDGGLSCSTDASGNVFATGYFDSPSITFGSTTLTNAGAGTDDIFIVKYDLSGNVLWAKSAGGTDYDYTNSCATDANGNVFATGSFASASITFGSTTLTNAGAGTYDMFIVKYDPSGNVLWETNQSAGGTALDIGHGCATDAIGNVFVTGYFKSSSITFGSTTLTNASAGTNDMFVAKLAGVVGINEINGEENFLSLFPNPATSELRIQNAELKIDRIEIYNTLGEKIYSKQPQTSNLKPQTVDVSQLLSGIYFIKVKGEKEEVVAKFIKQ